VGDRARPTDQSQDNPRRRASAGIRWVRPGPGTHPDPGLPHRLGGGYRGTLIIVAGFASGEGVEQLAGIDAEPGLPVAVARAVNFQSPICKDLEMNSSVARFLMDGVRLVLGAIRVEGLIAPVVGDGSFEVQVRDVVGRAGYVRFDPVESAGVSGADGGLVMSTSPRSEAIWAIALALVAIPLAIASILTITSGEGSGSDWFLAVWATAWATLVGYRLTAQGRALHAILASLSPRPNELRVSWTARRPGALPARRR
jgi:hypothetical protein